MATDTVLDLTTEIAEPAVFTVDGEPYHIFTYEHLSKEQEARIQALFRRFTRELTKLNTATDDRSAEAAATKNRETRTDILAALTDMPRELAEQLPQPQAAKLMKEISGLMRTELDDTAGE